MILHGRRIRQSQVKKMGWRQFILTEVFCGVLYFLSSTGCHCPKRACYSTLQPTVCAVHDDVLMPANVNIIEKYDATFFTLLWCCISHIPPNIDICQNRRHQNAGIFNLYELCSWQRVAKKIQVFLDMMPCRLANRWRSFIGDCWLLFHGSRVVCAWKDLLRHICIDSKNT